MLRRRSEGSEPLPPRKWDGSLPPPPDYARAMREGTQAEREEMATKYGQCLQCIFGIWCTGCQQGHCPKHCKGTRRDAVRFSPMYNGDAAFPLIAEHFPNDPYRTKEAFNRMVRETAGKRAAQEGMR